MKRSLAILGSTGSIGTQALEVISEHADLFEVYALTANNQVDLLINQARKYMPEVVVIANEQKYPELKEALEDLPIKVWAGSDAIAQVVQSEPIDMVLTAMVGYSGLKPTIAAIKAGKAIALANKETLVVAGELITSLATEHKVPVLPVDSEHSAIFQCLAGEWENQVEKILLTASGGPFRTKTMEELAVVTKAQALKHPNWSMGAKITIDSASMMNKGFEMIEAKWLFGVDLDKIIATLYSIAGETTGKQYLPRFTGDGTLEVVEKPEAARLEIARTMSVTNTWNIEKLCNSAAIYSKDGMLISRVEDAASQALKRAAGGSR